MAGVWAKLIPDDDVGVVTKSFQDAIGCSFDDDRSRVTQAEIKRRFEICCKIFENLCGDLKWSTAKALDFIPRYLRNELDGIPYTPDTRVLWTPSDPAPQGDRS